MSRSDVAAKSPRVGTSDIVERSHADRRDTNWKRGTFEEAHIWSEVFFEVTTCFCSVGQHGPNGLPHFLLPEF